MGTCSLFTQAYLSKRLRQYLYRFLRLVYVHVYVIYCEKMTKINILCEFFKC